MPFGLYPSSLRLNLWLWAECPHWQRLNNPTVAELLIAVLFREAILRNVPELGLEQSFLQAQLDQSLLPYLPLL